MVISPSGLLTAPQGCQKAPDDVIERAHGVGLEGNVLAVHRESNRRLRPVGEEPLLQEGRQPLGVVDVEARHTEL